MWFLFYDSSCQVDVFCVAFFAFLDMQRLISINFAGDDIWKYVGKISGAQKGVMDEKFKWTVSLIIEYILLGMLIWFLCLILSPVLIPWNIIVNVLPFVNLDYSTLLSERRPEKWRNEGKVSLVELERKKQELLRQELMKGELPWSDLLWIPG